MSRCPGNEPLNLHRLLATCHSRTTQCLSFASSVLSRPFLQEQLHVLRLPLYCVPRAVHPRTHRHSKAHVNVRWRGVNRVALWPFASYASMLDPGENQPATMGQMQGLHDFLTDARSPFSRIPSLGLRWQNGHLQRKESYSEYTSQSVGVVHLPAQTFFPLVNPANRQVVHQWGSRRALPR